MKARYVRRSPFGAAVSERVEGVTIRAAGQARVRIVQGLDDAAPPPENGRDLKR